jgi:hypothetical protein
MISDVLAEASTQIQSYLDEPDYAHAYRGAVRERIKQLVVEMKTIQGELDTPPQSKPNLSISPALPSSSPESGMLPEGIGYKDTKAEQMVRLLKQFQVTDRGQFIIDCINGKENKYIYQHQEEQVVKPLAKWLRVLAGRP